jgi:hypothetical protein
LRNLSEFDHISQMYFKKVSNQLIERVMLCKI